jgi:hypothetical protein|tara:strand:+ start:5843 stop:6088 length:246 start_codon:yes stop_codon:yes gene_type:complete
MSKNKYIGSRYEETRNLLLTKIRTGLVSVVEAIPDVGCCYLCSQPVKGVRLELRDEQIDGFARYFVDDGCYQRARQERLME